MFLAALIGLAPANRRAVAEAWAADERVEFTQVHMGLPVRIVLYARDADLAARAAAAAFDRVAALDAIMSDYRRDSELNRVDTRWRTVSPELFDVLARAVEIARATDGRFDPTVGPLVRLWRDARRTRALPAPDQLSGARAGIGWHHIDLDRRRRAVRLARDGMRLDLGGIAKGWILQDAARVLRDHHVARVLVEGGGDIVAGDPPPGQPGWRIEVHGADESFTSRAARMSNAALATSGPAVQFVEIGGTRYSHVVDPRTGLGLTNNVMAHVIASDGATADALATALTVAGPDRARDLLARFPHVNASVKVSPN
jgi:FAD:protein FMN transferase